MVMNSHHLSQAVDNVKEATEADKAAALKEMEEQLIERTEALQKNMMTRPVMNSNE